MGAVLDGTGIVKWTENEIKMFRFSLPPKSDVNLLYVGRGKGGRDI